MATKSFYFQLNQQKYFASQTILNPENPTIIFLHDSLGCVELWRDFPIQLAQKLNYNIFIYDRIGYGKSDALKTYIRPNNYLEIEADILIQICNLFNLNKPILFGHSDGASIVLIAAAKYPNTFGAVISEAGHIFVEDITLQGINDAIRQFETTNLPEKLAKYHGNKVDDIYKAWTVTWTRSEFRSWSVEDLMKNISIPLLFIQGENDEFGSLDQVYKTTEKAQGISQTFILPNIGHSPHKEATNLVIDEVSNFLIKMESK